jgi:hypothetical protein
LHDQDHFVDAGAYGVDSDDVAFLISAIDVHEPRYQELATVKTLILARCYYSSNYSGKNHGFSDA